MDVGEKLREGKERREGREKGEGGSEGRCVGMQCFIAATKVVVMD